ncbi:MAG: UDP-N-acetylmuramoyl-L-alanyl-D-glutamate--2,6-diaminopimelate ligase [Anaerolineales bacterium]|nr:UDP-N-acetylmuramoyl-L-alanyl-D-glutamate--2,6-diaminopimelate ligase [Anaerolineales bacterium]
MSMQQLDRLLDGFPVVSPVHAAEVSGIAVDSRRVQPGDVFVATSDRVDGHQYIPDAVRNGAAAVIGTEEIKTEVPYVRVEDARAALAHISATFYRNPANQLTLIGVTGSDGKTSTVNFLYQILKAAGLAAGMISTVNAIIGDQVLDTGLHVTTPEAFEVQSYLRGFVETGITHVVLETTSHGLAARRVNGAEFDIGVVTNITHEHLDYHGSWEAYLAAKGRLFEGLSKPKRKSRPVEPLAVLNRDDRSYEPLQALTSARQVSYGGDSRAEVWASEIENTPEVLRFVAHGPGFKIPIETRMIGNYNVWNILAALSATTVGLGIDPETAAKGVRMLEGIPGRMERIDLGQDFLAVVDFAHTPYAIRSVLEAGRKMTSGRVIAVFGSAGLRDKQKRRMMAEISAELADLSVLTAEDPRTESLDDILAEMAGGAESKGGIEGQTFFCIPDRGAAIEFAVEQAQPGDLVFALGKGHEQSMCFDETEYPWDDRTAMRAALAKILGLEGVKMPYLPTQETE